MIEVSGDDPGKRNRSMLHNDAYARITTRLEAALNLTIFEDAFLDHTEPAKAWIEMLR